MHTFILQTARIPEKYLSDRPTQAHKGLLQSGLKPKTVGNRLQLAH
ncbi:hypothetical protein H6F86_22500 [Phormidium sp. FACHB-592]|uniref:Uncharacterized protein n=1 Tax=Stenomitos frigidus AS-A4 TaxID=2933935 RepID=A0ABV0KFJ4_9CYAN|nr:hypothetical protein [Phormidium sp. FACHB-592]MBD2076605.1 hypothetical protein [Phormidium sp. FACHB-592]